MSGVELLVGVLVALFATDERLVHLDDPAERASVAAARFAEATQHEQAVFCVTPISFESWSEEMPLRAVTSKYIA